MATWDDGRGQYLNDDGTPDTGGDTASAFAPVKKPAAPLPFSAPGAGGGVPLEASAQVQPNPGLVQAQANSPDPMAFAAQGAPLPQTPTAPIAPTPSPATSGGANIDPIAPVTPITTPVQGMGAGDVQGNSRGGPTPLAPTMSTQDWGNYSPLAGKSEKEKTDYWAGQGVQGLANVGYTPPPATGAGSVVVDPAKAAAATSAYTAANQPAIDAITRQVQGGQADALAATNRGQDAIGFDTAVKDADANLGSIQAVGGTAGGPQAAQAFRDSQIRGGGFEPSGRPIGASDLDTVTRNIAPPSDSQRTPGGTGSTSTAVDALNGLVPPPAPTQTGLPDFGPTWAPAAPPAPATPAVPPGGGAGTSATAGPNNGVSLTNINPDDSLIGKQISPGHNVDRVKTFQDSLNSTITNVLDPAMQARMRDLNRYNFGAGRGVSGIARTSQGDVASDYSRQIADLTAQGLAGATTGSIGDYYKNVDESQQERGYQADRSDTAFDQAVRGTELEDYLTGTAFTRAERQSNAGEAGNPSDIAKWMSINYGMQAGDAMKAASQIFSAMGKRAGEGGGVSGEDVMSMVRQIFGPPKTPATSNGGYVDDTSDRSRVNV